MNTERDKYVHAKNWKIKIRIFKFNMENQTQKQIDE